ncbi:dipeptide ABC transporter ATP-binding protein [Rhizobium rhizogenes]|uniref:dipeptide ABC transporter ATP-binding protein n=1 Tax=Rhizobium rhizogenes TaxID=359 RepID=UPI001571868B|nr:ABC transporter ATP-binding protein [Rhizobium rhizogenes]NTF58718.1 ABC transporter ATP-binding protein [Rhizobium rhizogenes]NTF78302.1 ABC transporter ATP-binding protein [Rhizobium rhizogenes]NTF97225.1 ABC transporter ATP-binding protein [Rhizobium rhizogenes]NTH54827.1 ABC transporter ATP-binding protein [Rhizobium rhizogenes]NTH74405.1 ABC transporter ATP-binding protein [Rhizobium rhizogenes]
MSLDNTILRSHFAAVPSSPALLEVKGLSVTFPTPSGRVQAVRDVSFQIAAGEILALVGESGSGKSVTARALVGLAGSRADVRAEAMTLVGHDGQVLDLQGLSERSWRQLRGREVGFVLQDALLSLDPLRTVGREVAEPILAHRLLPRSQVAERVEELLGRAGIPDPKIRAAQYPHELSGGLRQRALIASALAAQPRLLIADEPTTALDVTVQRQVLAVFKELARAGHAVLIITHDLAVAAQLANRVVVMQNGQLVEAGPVREVLSRPLHDYTRRLLAAVPTAATRGHWLSATDGAPIPRKVMEAEAPLLEIRDVSVSFRRPDGSRLEAVKQVSLKVGWGETLGIVGESGSGKTTLGKVALGLRHAANGDVLFEGKPWSTLAEAERRPLRNRIQTISQDPLGSFDPRFTVERIIDQPLRLRGKLDQAARRRRIAELIELVGLSPELLSRRPNTLSGGQRQRVSIAQALAAEPKLLICDEPVSALDVTTQAQVLDLLVDLQGRLGLSMVFISHDLGVVQHMSHRIAVMKDGVVVETGPVEQLFDQPQHPYTRDLIASVPSLSAPGERI